MILVSSLFLFAHAAPVRLGLVVTSNEGLATEEILRFADSDGDQVAAMLRDVAGFEADHLIRVRHSSREDLEVGMRRLVLLAAELEGRGESIDLLVYYTGHAGVDGLHLDNTSFPLAELKAAARLVPAERRVFVVDACQSGRFMRSKGATLVEMDEAPLGFQPPPEEAWITSSGAEENAFEVDRRRGSLFSHFFVSGGRGAADLNTDGEVTLGELYLFARQQVSHQAAIRGVVQQPLWAGQHGSWRLSEPGRASSGLEAIGPVSEPLLVIRQGSRQVAAELPVGKGGRLALPSGRYQLVSVAGAHPRRTDVVIKANGWHRVELDQALRPTSGLRSRGGLFVGHTWSVVMGYGASLGGAPGRKSFAGPFMEIERAVGRGNRLGLVVTGGQLPLSNPWVSGKLRMAEARLIWGLDLMEGLVQAGPGLEMGPGLVNQTIERAPDGPWGEWYGEANAFQVLKSGSGEALAGLRLGIRSDRMYVKGWVGAGAILLGDERGTLEPTVNARVGIGWAR